MALNLLLCHPLMRLLSLLLLRLQHLRLLLLRLQYLRLLHLFLLRQLLSQYVVILLL